MEGELQPSAGKGKAPSFCDVQKPPRLHHKEIKNEHSNQGSPAREVRAQPRRAPVSWDMALPQLLRGPVLSTLPLSQQSQDFCSVGFVYFQYSLRQPLTMLSHLPESSRLFPRY